MVSAEEAMVIEGVTVPWRRQAFVMAVEPGEDHGGSRKSYLYSLDLFSKVVQTAEAVVVP
jgi:hypothetical protein